MRVTVVRGGGFAGLSTRTELSSDDLAEQETRELRDLVREAPLRAPVGTERARPWPDQLHYEVVLEDDGDVSRARFTDADLPEGVRRLLQWVDSRPERSQRRER